MGISLAGLEIEGEQLGVVGAIMLAVVPAYLWAGKAGDSQAIVRRAALAGTVLVAAAIAAGLGARK